jgi:hypothetical protein
LLSHVEHAAWANLGGIRYDTIPGGLQARKTLTNGPRIHEYLRRCPLLTYGKLIKLSLQDSPFLQCFLL